MYGGGVVTKSGRVTGRGLTHSNHFIHALNSLHEVGFITELWTDKKNSVLTLVWHKNGAQWHVTAPHIKSLPTQLDQIGHNACAWLMARQSGTSNESNFAVRDL